MAKAGRLNRSTRTSGDISRIYRIRALCKATFAGTEAVRDISAVERNDCVTNNMMGSVAPFEMDVFRTTLARAPLTV